MFKNKQEAVSETEFSVREAGKTEEKLAQFSLQKQLQVLNLREVIVLGSFILVSGISRVFMQGIPSVEPIIFFAVLAGWMFGGKKGFTVGAAALLLSNFFVYGGQGLWTIFQALGFGIAGFIGGLLRKKSGLFECFIAMMLATLSFEIIVNTGSVIVNPVSIFSYFLLGLPFTLIHLASNGIFSLALPKAKSFVERRGHFDEREIYHEFLEKFTKLRRRK